MVAPAERPVHARRQQDQDLDELSESVARLGQVGRTIGEELDTQGKLLDELEEDVDGTTTRLGAAQKKLVQVIKRSGMGGQMAIVGVLLVRAPPILQVGAVSRKLTSRAWHTDHPRRLGCLHIPLRRGQRKKNKNVTACGL